MNKRRSKPGSRLGLRDRTKPVITMRELVETLVPNGQEVLIGGFAFSDPVAFAHELIRQGRSDLRVMKTSGGVLVDQLIGAGCVRELVFSHVWNSVGPVPAHCLRRAIESGTPAPIAFDEMSYGAFTMSLFAGAYGLPFMPTTPVQGTGQFTHRPLLKSKFAVVESPFDGTPTCVVPPLRPELGVFHVQRVDKFGNAQILGPIGETKGAMLASRSIVVVAEEMVDTRRIRARPELTVIPGFSVDAIVIEPWNAHPSDAYGYYRRDIEHHALYGRLSSTQDGYQGYINDYVLGTDNHAEFRRKLGSSYLGRLMTRRSAWW